MKFSFGKKLKNVYNKEEIEDILFTDNFFEKITQQEICYFRHCI